MQGIEVTQPWGRTQICHSQTRCGPLHFASDRQDASSRRAYEFQQASVKKDSLRCASRCETETHCPAVRPTAGDAAPDGPPHTVADRSGHRQVHPAPPISQGPLRSKAP